MIQSTDQQQDSRLSHRTFSLRLLGSYHYGQSISLPASGDFVVGRSRRCDLRIMSASVSRMHCHLRLNEDGALRVADMNSLTGTFVNDRRVDGVTILNDGDILRIGPARVQVVVKHPTESEWYSFEPLRGASNFDSTRQRPAHTIHARELSGHSEAVSLCAYGKAKPLGQL